MVIQKKIKEKHSFKLNILITLITISFSLKNVLFAQEKGSFGFNMNVVGWERKLNPLLKDTYYESSNISFNTGFAIGVNNVIYLKRKKYLSIGLNYSLHRYSKNNIQFETVFGSYFSVGKIRKIQVPVQLRSYISLNPNLEFVYGLGVSFDIVLKNYEQFVTRFIYHTGNNVYLDQAVNLENKSYVLPAIIPGIYLKYNGAGRRYWIFGITGHIYAPYVRFVSSISTTSGLWGPIIQSTEKNGRYFAPNYISCQVQYMFSRKKK